MTLRKGILVSDLLLQEQGTLISGLRSSIVFQQIITSWLTTQLNALSTNDACAEISAQAFEINSCQTAAHQV